jgi:predicted Ser/Thr protein kinase/type II secretory pathway pseudopilin PulG
METIKICPNCRKPLPPDVPLGLCPECLIKSGFPTGTEPGAAAEAAGVRFVPPPVSEIAQLFPQLEILRFIGKGGMGAVYKARQPALDRFVALKVLPPAVAGDPGFNERFNREARALARLNHPNIVAVHDFGKAGPLHYLLMEFVDGANLREVERAGELSPAQALAIVPQICEALQFAHNEGIVHRDIKPENLLLDKKGRVKITDFGIAKMVGIEAGQEMLTGAKDVMGTPHYMAPEQLEKPLTVDHRADIYSLGVVFYEMLTGELPLGKFQPPSQKVQIDVRLDEVVMHALEKEPSRRYQHASLLKTEVETIASTAAPGATGFASGPAILPPTVAPAIPATSDKAILPAFLLAFFFGIFGAHRFYVGKIGTAFLQLAALGGCVLLIIGCAAMGGRGQPTLGILLGFLICSCGIWMTVDWILILCKAFTDGHGRRINHWFHAQSGELKTSTTAITNPPPTPTPPKGGTAPAAGASYATPPIAPVTPKANPVAGTGKIVAPAVVLMVVALWKLLSAFSSGLFLFPGGIGWLDKIVGGHFLGGWGSAAIFSLVLFKLILGALILFGAFQMLRLQSYAWSVAAGILAIMSCSLFSLPIGIWALVVLSMQDVQAAFGANKVPLVSPTPGHEIHVANPWRFTGIFLAIGSAVALIILLVLAGLLFASLNGSTANATTLKFAEELHQTYPLAADGRISLDNVNGTVRISVWDRPEVKLDAIKRANSKDHVDAVNIQINANPDYLAIRTKNPSEQHWSFFNFGNVSSVDYTLTVPQSVRLDKISDVNGNVDIDGVRGDVNASTVNGSLTAQGLIANASLSTVNGAIHAGFANLNAARSVSLDTVNGRADLELPPNANASVAADTVNGGITSDFPSLLVKKDFPVGRHLKGTLGNGGTQVKAHTVNGSIAIQQGKPAAPALSAPSPEAEKAATAAAQAWLALIDDGRYSESWNEAEPYFQRAVTEPNWEISMNTYRRPLGNLLSRQVKSAQFMTEMPGAPDGQYVVMQFDSSFTNKKSTVETVTFKLADDGKWKASGYFIK